MYLLVYLALLTDPNTLALGDLGIYGHNSFIIQKHQDRYVLVSDMDHTILVLDQNGAELYRHDKKGEGPEELKWPTLFGVTDRYIYINDRSTVKVFDHQLQQIQTFIPKLPLVVWGGQAISDDVFLVDSSPNKPFFALTLLKRGKEEWTIADQILKLETEKADFGIVTNKQYARFHQNKVLVSVGYLNDLEGDYYEVMVHTLSDSFKTELARTLKSKRKTFPQFSSSDVYLSRALPFSQGYVVHVTIRDKQDVNKWVAEYLDIFSRSGAFVKRLALDYQAFLLPVLGSDNTYLVNRDDAVATLFVNP